MTNENHELTIDELDLVSGGTAADDELRDQNAAAVAAKFVSGLSEILSGTINRMASSIAMPRA